jgi:hypothetical protein
MQAALTSVAYNYGRLPTTVSSAVVTGNPEAVAKAIEGLQGHNDGINRDRRLREAAIIRGATVSSGRAVSAQEVKAYRKDATGFLKDTWSDVEKGLKDGIQPDAETMLEIGRYARLADDPDTVAKVSAGLQTYGQVMPATAPTVPVADQLAAVNAEGAAMQASGADPASVEVWRIKRERAQANEVKLKADPLLFYDVTRGPTEAAQRTAELDPANPQAFSAELQKRTTAADFVESYQQISGVSVLRPGEAARVGAAIGGQDANVAQTAMLGLSSLPPERLVATIAEGPVKDALAGAARSTDPARYTAAMTALDEMWSKAPQDVAKVLGSDTVRAVQDWQAKFRYYSAAEMGAALAKQDDPQVAKRREALESKGEGLARKKTVDSLVDDFDPSIFVNGPDVPTDPGTRDVLMADYERLFGERYAVSQDEALAHTQAMQRMKIVWGKSAVNGGRLTMYPPEQTYSAVNGSHDWMGEELTADLKKTLGKPPANYSVVADRMTEADVTAGRAPSYMIVTVDPETGVSDVVRTPDQKPLRYRWDDKHAVTDARDRFERQRARIFKQAAPDRPATQTLMQPPWRGQN